MLRTTRVASSSESSGSDSGLGYGMSSSSGESESETSSIDMIFDCVCGGLGFGLGWEGSTLIFFDGMILSGSRRISSEPMESCIAIKLLYQSASGDSSSSILNLMRLSSISTRLDIASPTIMPRSRIRGVKEER